MSCVCDVRMKVMNSVYDRFARGVSRVRASCTVPLARIRRKLNWVEITALSAVRAGSASRLASVAEGLAGAPLRVCCSLSIGSVGRGALVLPYYTIL